MSESFATPRWRRGGKRFRAFDSSGTPRPYKRLKELIKGNTDMVRRTRTLTKRRRGRKRTGRLVRYKRAPLNVPWAVVRRVATVIRGTIDPAVNSDCTVQVFNLNSCYDPAGANGTQQPLYFDQYMAMYKKYCVIGYKVTIDCVSSDNSNAVIVGFTPMTTDTALTVPRHYVENKSTTHRTITQDIDKTTFGNKGSIKRWLRPGGGSLINDLYYSGDASSNPNNLLYGHFWAAAIAPTTDPSTVYYFMRIEQIVKFYEPVTPALS